MKTKIAFLGTFLQGSLQQSNSNIEDYPVPDKQSADLHIPIMEDREVYLSLSVLSRKKANLMIEYFEFLLCLAYPLLFGTRFTLLKKT